MLERDDEDPMESIQTVNDYINNFDVLPEQTQEEFTNIHLPKITKAVLDRRYAHERFSYFVTIHYFLKKLIPFVIANLCEKFNGLLEVIRRLWNEDKDFFDNRIAGFPKEINDLVTRSNLYDIENEIGDPSMLKIRLKCTTLNRYGYVTSDFPYMLNVFCRFAGFQKILVFLNNGKPSVTSVQAVLFNINEIKEWLETGFLKEYILQLKDSIQTFMMNIDEV